MTHPLNQFRPESEVTALDAMEARTRDRQDAEVLPPLMVVRKAGTPTADVEYDVPPIPHEQLLMRLRDAWSRTPPLKPLLSRVRSHAPSLTTMIGDVWTSTWRIRLIPDTGERQSGPPLWLVACFTCVVVPVLITLGSPAAPVRMAEQRDAVSMTQRQTEVSEFDPRLLIPGGALRLLVSGPGNPIQPAGFARVAPPSVSAAKPAVIPQARSLTQQPKALRTPATRLFEGTLHVSSEPAGATVFVDRRPVGVTPLEITKVRAGSHAVWVESEGYVRWTAAVHVRFNSVTRVEPKLQRQTDR
jgi:hypothetical protein